MRKTIFISLVFLVMLACGIQGEVSESSQAALETAAPEGVVAQAETETPVEASLMPIDVEESTSTVAMVPSSTSEPQATEVLAVPEIVGLAERLCSQVPKPAGLFRVPEIYSNSKEEEPTQYEIYQISALFPEAGPEFCTLFISPFKLGDFQFGGDTLFWHSYNDETEQAVVWKYDPLDKLADEVDPLHVPLTYSALNLPPEFLGLIGFVIAPNGENLAWSITEPKLNEDNQYAFFQDIYFGDVIGEDYDLLRGDVIIDDYPHNIELRELSSTSNLLYYSDEPVGLGTSYPRPAGVYSSLYSMPTWGEEMPTLHHDCGMEHWCISDFSEEHDLLVYFEDTMIMLIRLNGESVSSVLMPDGYNFIRQGLIGPGGDLVFLALKFDEADFFGDPDDAAVFHLEPPYDGAPTLTASSPELRNILGWISADQVLTDIIFRIEGLDEGEVPTHLNVVNLSDGSMGMLIHQANNFIQLVP
jgi:hypothetical protein